MNKRKAALVTSLTTFLIIILLSNYPILVNGYTVVSTSTYTQSIVGSGDTFKLFKTGTVTSQYTSFLSNSNLVINTYNFTTTKSTLEFSNIIAQNATQVIEDSLASGNQKLKDGDYMSFTVNKSCILSNISVKVILNVGEVLNISLFNSTWTGTDYLYDTLINTTSFTISASFDGWYNVTLDWKLDVTNTQNNTFFIYLITSSPYQSYWYYTNDDVTGDGLNEGTAYDFTTLLAVDFSLKVGLAPLVANPLPSEVNMKVNGTPVVDTATGGIWESYQVFYTNPAYLITADWPVSTDITTTLLVSRDEYSDNATYTATLGSSTTIWDVLINSTAPSSFSELNTTLTTPSDWVISSIKLNSTASTSYTINSNNITLIGIGVWNLSFIGNNYLSPNTPSVSTYNGENTTLTFVFNYPVVIPDYGSGIISVYNTTGDLIANFSTVPESNGTALIMIAYWVPSAALSAGTYNITGLWCNGTEVGFAQFTINLIHPSNLSANNTNIMGTIGDNITVNVTYSRNDTGEAIEGATVVGTWIFESNIRFLDLGNGIYSANITTNSSYTPGTYELNITANKSGYQENTITVFITLQYKTTISVEKENICYYNVTSNITIFYTDANGTGIEGANGTYTSSIANGSLVELGSGYYALQIRVTSLGTYSVTITLKKPGYQTQTVVILIVVNPRPTRIIIEGSTTVYWGGNITLSVHYLDVVTNSDISNWNISISGLTPNVYTLSWTDATYYTLIMNTQLLNATTYDLTIQGVATNYNISYLQLQITVLKSSLSIQLPKNITQYENETLIFDVQVTDAYHDFSVSGASISVKFNKAEYQGTEIAKGVYEFRIPLKGVSPGEYESTMTASCANYNTTLLNFSIFVLPKENVELSLTTPSVFKAGASITISAKLTYINGTPIAGESLYFYVTFEYVNKTTTQKVFTAVTDKTGVATVVIQTTMDTQTITVVVKYKGSTALEPATLSRNITEERAASSTNGLFGVVFTSPDNTLYLLLLVGLVLSSVIAIRKFVTRRISKIHEYKFSASYYKELLKIRHLLIIHSKSGLNLYYNAYSTEPFEPVLISGFITALTQFGSEIIDKDSEITELKRRGLYIFSVDTNVIRVVVMSEVDLSETFKKIFVTFVKELGQEFDEKFKDWSGDVRGANVIGETLEKKLGINLFYSPIKMVATASIKSDEEKKLLEKVGMIVERLPNIDIKKIIDMLGEECDISLLVNLVKKGVIVLKENKKRASSNTEKKTEVEREEQLSQVITEEEQSKTDKPKE